MRRGGASRFGWLAVTLALYALLPASARADLAAEARFHDQLAREHYRAGRYEEALREFFLHRRLAPNAIALYNIALCFERLEEPAEAFLFYSEYLTSDDHDTERRRRVDAALERLRPSLALVEVRSDPEGATIYVDRRDRGSYGIAPMVIPVAPGVRELELELEGHHAQSVRVEAARGERVLASVTLRPVLGSLEIDGPSGGHVEVRDAEGTLVHEAGLPARAELPPHDYHVEVRAPGYEVWRGLTRVSEGQVAHVHASNVPLPPPTGELTVTSNAAGALVAVDGEPAGFAPTIFSELAVGTHRLRVQQPGLQAWEGEVEVVAEERAWLTVTLEPPARVERSPATWAVGGVAAAALVGAGVTGAIAIDAHSRWVNTADLEARATGSALAITTDALLITAAVGAVVSVVLWFATEHLDQRRSRSTLSREAR